jgi:hypothetical protein
VGFCGGRPLRLGGAGLGGGGGAWSLGERCGPWLWVLVGWWVLGVLVGFCAWLWVL